MCPIPYKVLLPETPGARTKGWGEDRTGPLVWGARWHAGQVPLFLPPLLLLLSPLLPPPTPPPPSLPLPSPFPPFLLLLLLSFLLSPGGYLPRTQHGLFTF